MKKTYISPAIETVEIKGTMMAGSVGADLEGVTPSNDKPTELSIRGFRTVTFIDDEEEQRCDFCVVLKFRTTIKKTTVNPCSAARVLQGFFYALSSSLPFRTSIGPLLQCYQYSFAG